MRKAPFVCFYHPDKLLQSKWPTIQTKGPVCAYCKRLRAGGCFFSINR
uniref:Uncharacterized protein n=1 Tax=Anguilla anguilla TaxID=7936 RepID=A0A0E9VC83_ANGAN